MEEKTGRPIRPDDYTSPSLKGKKIVTKHPNNHMTCETAVFCPWPSHINFSSRASKCKRPHSLILCLMSTSESSFNNLSPKLKAIYFFFLFFLFISLLLEMVFKYKFLELCSKEENSARMKIDHISCHWKCPLFVKAVSKSASLLFWGNYKTPAVEVRMTLVLFVSQLILRKHSIGPDRTNMDKLPTDRTNMDKLPKPELKSL